MSDPSASTPHTPTDPEIYRPHIDTTFSIDATPAPVELRLAAVEDVVVEAGALQFSLLFHGSPEQLVPPGTYVLQHAALGLLLLYVAPIQGSTRQRILYQACFNVVAPG
jgi:hypothetical protein